MTKGRRIAEEAKKRGLGRRAAPDPRDKRFPARAARKVVAPRPRTLPYRTGPVLDQGAEPECVGFAWRAMLAAAPNMRTSREPTPRGIYVGAQDRDEWDDTPPEGGSSVRAGAKFLQETSDIEGSYVWMWHAKEMGLWLREGRGTVVLGTLWYPSMYVPDEYGIIVPDPETVEPDGGHAYHGVWWWPEPDLFLFQQSWGLGWGNAKLPSGRRKPGFFLMHGRHVERLIQEEGEVAAATEIKVKAVAA